DLVCEVLDLVILGAESPKGLVEIVELALERLDARMRAGRRARSGVDESKVTHSPMNCPSRAIFSQKTLFALRESGPTPGRWSSAAECFRIPKHPPEARRGELIRHLCDNPAATGCVGNQCGAPCGIE